MVFTSAEGEVVVLAGAIDTIEWLLLEEAGHVVAGSHLLRDLHHHQVLVDLSWGLSGGQPM